MKFKILILFILFSSVVLGVDNSEVINLNLIGSDNLTIQIEDQFWWFNIYWDGTKYWTLVCEDS